MLFPRFVALSFVGKFVSKCLSTRAMPSFVTKPAYLPAKKGDAIDEIDTPALIIDMDNLEFNLAALPKIVQSLGSAVTIRPHAKAHKSADIAKMQLQYSNAVGVCCAKLWEAETLAKEGVKDILISNEVVGRKKLERLAMLAKVSDMKLSVCVDNVANVHEMAKVMEEMDSSVDVVVEVNVGQNRCGVLPGPDVVPVVQAVGKEKNLCFKGLQTYHGGIQFVRTKEERLVAVQAVKEKIACTLSALREHSIEVNYITGGGTGTFMTDCELRMLTEIQPGSYIFMDVNYGNNLFHSTSFYHSLFRQSLYVLSTVQSNSSSCPWIVIDAGMKSVSLDSGPPAICNVGMAPSSKLVPQEYRANSFSTSVYSSLEYVCGGDEHGILVDKELWESYKLQGSCLDSFQFSETPALKMLKQTPIDSKVLLIPGHCDPTVNLHDYFVCVRNGIVENVLPIVGRGPGF